MSLSALDVVCEANGFSKTEVLEHPERFTEVELFLVPYSEMKGLSFFPALKKLEIIDQQIRKVCFLSLEFSFVDLFTIF